MSVSSFRLALALLIVGISCQGATGRQRISRAEEQGANTHLDPLQPTIAKKDPNVGNHSDAPKKKTVGELLNLSLSKAFRGGVAGFAAAILQVMMFMWLRTIMNTQYYHGGTALFAAQGLWAEGGFLRFYRGFGWAIIDCPTAKFGDTFANTGMLTLLAGVAISPLIKTVAVSLTAATWRIIITPLDTLKTTMQVQGDEGYKILSDKCKAGGILIMWSGALANFVANYAGNYPWFAMYNNLEASWPPPPNFSGQIFRHGIIGIVSSVVSDIISNSFRVLKTIRQAHPDAELGYTGAFQKVVKTDGVVGLFTRGLLTRILCNSLQSMVFSIAWKVIEHKLNAS